MKRIMLVAVAFLMMSVTMMAQETVQTASKKCCTSIEQCAKANGMTVAECLASCAKKCLAGDTKCCLKKLGGSSKTTQTASASASAELILIGNETTKTKTSCTKAEKAACAKKCTKAQQAACAKVCNKGKV